MKVSHVLQVRHSHPVLHLPPRDSLRAAVRRVVQVSSSSTRRRWGRRVAIVGGLAVIAALAVVALTFRRQLASYLTHWRGAPDHTWPYQKHAEEPVVHLAFAGDTGDAGEEVQATADAMQMIGSAEHYDALVLLGDLVYPSGDATMLDTHVFEPFDGVLHEGTDLLAVLGNHDVMLGEGDDMMRRLGMSGRWWQRVIGDVTVIGLDTTRVDDPVQLAFLENTLESADTTWTIVAMHHPPYSAGYQGSSIDARRAFAPLFEQYGVQLVLAGHDHDYQRSEVINGVTYVVSGAGSGTRRTGTEDFTAVSFAFLHFVDVAAYDDHLVVRAVGADREVADEFTLVPAGVP
ncbi:MAG: metallophosphoesterase family protein [Ilumatobacteraceae bacterium]